MTKAQIKQKNLRTESLMVTLFSIINAPVLSDGVKILQIQEIKNQLTKLGVEL